MKKIKNRCSYVNSNPLYIKYHDTEWGIPVHDDRHMFEHLCLESVNICNRKENIEL